MEGKKKNLKGTEDKLTYVRHVETGKTFPRQRGKKGEGGEVEIEVYHVPELEQRVFTEEEVKSFSLDRFGKSIPYVDGELTIMNNYLFDYWGYYLKAEGLALYAHLKRHAYGKKDWCFPSLDLIAYKMDKSPNTVRNYLEVLEHFGFVYRFMVYNADRDNSKEPSLYKLRKQVPLLTDKLINGDHELVIDDSLPPHMRQVLQKQKKGLPKALKDDHNKYVANMIENNETIDILDSFTYEEIYAELLKRAKASKLESMELEIKKSEQISLKPHVQLTKSDEIIWKAVLNQLEDKISKPSFETWFKNTYCMKDDKTYYIYTQDEFQRDRLESAYSSIIDDTLATHDEDYLQIKYMVIPR
ncbi:DnaA N-terminal domain-containing protein [Metabacillus fastidiosus]|uniref:DnaA N-terminal domain-containing protein n=1 Tax=Metabacillus fastidiosus TaxID=1458 RepID=UPI003D27EB92